MRIISGNLKGKKIFSPSDQVVRPTSDRAREMIFNILSSIFKKDNISFSNLNVLDCFCGTGALGLESYSRGAKKVIFVDKSKKSLDLTQRNITKLQVNNFEIEKVDLTKHFERNANIDLFFFDPPYMKNILNISLKNLIESTWLKDNSYGVVESNLSNNFSLPIGWQILKERTIRKSIFFFIKSKGSFSSK